MYNPTFRQKYNLIFVCCVLFLLLQANCLAAEETRNLMDIIPYDTIACLSISNLDEVSHTAVNLPEWDELYSIDEIKEGLEQPKHLLTMLLGLTPEEFVKAFGHKLVFGFLGIENDMPIACLAIDVENFEEDARYAMEQLVSFTALGGEMAPIEDSYRDLPYTKINLDEFEIDYGFLDNFVLCGINGGFEKLVDLYKDGGKSIQDNPNFQFMSKKISLSSEICLFANVEQALQILPQLQKLMNKDEPSPEQSEKDKEFQEFLEKTILPSVKGFGISLSLSDVAHEAYLHVEPNADNLTEIESPLFELLLSPHPTMSSIKFLPADGALVSIQIGAPEVLLDEVLNVAEFFGQNKNELEQPISELEKAVGLDLRDDLLSALTGEIGVMALLPKEEVDLRKNKLDFAKFRPTILLGVKDQEKLEKTVSKLTKLGQVETQTLNEESHAGSKIYTKLLPLDVLVPGVALMPAYAYQNDLLIVSNSAEWVKDVIDTLAEPRQRSLNTEIEKELKSSWILAFANAGEILDFVTRQNLIEDWKLHENAIDKLSDFGTVTVSYSAEPDGIGVGIFSENPWIEEILRVVVLGIYADQAKAE